MASAITTEQEFIDIYNVKPGEHLNNVVLNRNENKLKQELNLVNNYQRYFYFGDTTGIPEWVLGTINDVYTKGTLVLHNGIVYYALVNVSGSIEPGTDDTKWTKFTIEIPSRLDLVFDTFNIINMSYTVSGLLSIIDYEGGYRIKLYYNADDLLELAEYYDVDGLTKLADNILTYNTDLLLETATWHRY